MNEIVLDSSAVLALLWQEKGADIVRDALPQAVISSVNVSEVVAKMSDRGMPAELVYQMLISLQARIEPFDFDQAYQAGLLRPATRAAGLSLGDRACIGLAKRLEARALTGDRKWEKLHLGVQIELIRQ